MAGRSPDDLANELYSRHFTATRAEADALVAGDPGVVEQLLTTRYPPVLELIDLQEMTHRDDRAAGSEWGTLG